MEHKLIMSSSDVHNLPNFYSFEEVIKANRGERQAEIVKMPQSFNTNQRDSIEIALEFIGESGRNHKK
jgi:hypothetical protein